MRSTLSFACVLVLALTAPAVAAESTFALYAAPGYHGFWAGCGTGMAATDYQTFRDVRGDLGERLSQRRGVGKTWLFSGRRSRLHVHPRAAAERAWVHNVGQRSVILLITCAGFTSD